MTDHSETLTTATPGEPDPQRFQSDTTTGAFWYELLLRNRDGSHEVKLTEVEGQVNVASTDPVTLTPVDFDETLANALEHLAEVIRCGR